MPIPGYGLLGATVFFGIEEIDDEHITWMDAMYWAVLTVSTGKCQSMHTCMQYRMCILDVYATELRMVPLRIVSSTIQIAHHK